MRRILRPHQIEAFEAGIGVLSAQHRASIVMACATGKTLVGLRIAEKFGRILLLEPSLALIRQALEYAREDGLLANRTVICVCSDKTVTGEDHWKVSDEELGVPVTTDAPTLRRLLTNSGKRCAVFCTYQSQPLLREALPPGFHFDFGNFDEAHRTAGARERAFSVALSDEYVPIRKRLFLTATPRFFAESKDGSGDATFSMDDERVYGPRCYELSLANAIARNIVCDAQVLTACVTGADVQQTLKNAHHLFLPQKKLPVEMVAGQIAVVRAIQATGARRVITFHQTIDQAAAFARDRLKIYQNSGVVAFHINGDMPGKQRQAVINAFLAMEQPSVLTNCHCLTEGVDVPTIDMVSFIDRRESQGDVAQAMGRALRLSPGKERGYVMLPLYVDEQEPLEAALERSDMAVTWEILHSVLEADGVLTDRLIHRGAVGQPESTSYSDHHGGGHLRLVAPVELLGDLQRAITMRHITRLSERWDVMSKAAQQYSTSNGHLEVPIDYMQDELPLGRWLEKQRILRKKERLPADRVAFLSSLGIAWNRHDRWDALLRTARLYQEKHGDFTSDLQDIPEPLKTWIRKSRRSLSSGQLSDTKASALMQLGIQPSVRRETADSLSALASWRTQNPDGTRPSRSGADRHVAFNLAYLISKFRQGRLDPTAIDRLTELGLDPRKIRRKGLTGYQLYGERSWDVHFQALKSYLSEHDWHHLWKVRSYQGVDLPGWCAYQKLQHRRGKLALERVAALDTLGIQWNLKRDRWSVVLDVLAEHRLAYGHQRLPLTPEFAPIRIRVKRLRQQLGKGELPEEVRARLKAMGFAQTRAAENWEYLLRSLADRKADGKENTEVPVELAAIMASGDSMAGAGALSMERLAQLRDVGVDWQRLGLHLPTSSAEWEAGLKAAQTYFAEHGSLDTDANTSSSALMTWLKSARNALSRRALTPQQTDQLRQLGIWAPAPQTSLETLSALTEWRRLHPEKSRPGRLGPDRQLAYQLNYLIAKHREGLLDTATLERLAELGLDPRQIRRKGRTTHQIFGERSWDLHHDALKAYLEHNNWGSLWRVRKFNGLDIYAWTTYQRIQRRKDRLSPERVAALDALAIQWGRKQDWWIKAITDIQEFRSQHGHQHLPTTSEYTRLRRAVSRLRTHLDKGTLPADAIAQLQRMGFVGNAAEEHWEFCVASLKNWTQAHGVLAYESPDFPKPLRAFLASQKRQHRAGKLSDHKLAQLRELGVRWAQLGSRHTTMIARLSTLARTIGKANVEVMARREPDLHEWLQAQLAAVANSELQEEAISDLHRVGIDVGEALTAKEAPIA